MGRAIFARPPDLAIPMPRGRARTVLTITLSVLASLALVALLVGKWDELSVGITGASALVVIAAIALQVVALVSRSEAWLVCVRASGGTVDTAPPLPGVEHGLRRRPAQRAAQLGSAHRRPASLGPRGDAARTDPHRRRASDPDGRGHARRAHLFHPRRAARPAVVAAVRLRGGDRRPEPRTAHPRAGERALAQGGARGDAEPPRAPPPGGFRAHRGVRADRPQLAAAPCGRGQRIGVRRGRRADRRGEPRPAAVRAQRRRRRERADPRSRGRGGRGRGRGAAHGHRQRRRAHLRRMGGCRRRRCATAGRGAWPEGWGRRSPISALLPRLPGRPSWPCRRSSGAMSSDPASTSSAT